MEIINGTYAQAKVFTDDMETYARAQLEMICNNMVAKNSKIRVMPDVHPGKVGTIGLTMTVGEHVIPNLLGIDIGCGMTCVKIKEKRLELQKLDKVIRERIPVGFAVRGKTHQKAEEFEIERLHCLKNVNSSKAYLSLGTLGGGNHFIEVDKDEDGTFYLIVHSGSRHLGKEVTEYYVETGAKELKRKGAEVPYELTWLEGEMLESYLTDVSVVQDFAQLNREIILWEILKEMKLKAVDTFSAIHNYVDELQGERILRKGAISAREGELVIIPINMRDGVLLGVGKGNADWNYSAPHGSGRSMRRDEVKNRYTVSSFKNEMKGIYCSCIGADTLDEAPFAYRPVEQIRKHIEDTVEVTHMLKPVYNFKTGGKS
ncbi:MAG: RtcB family protein [Lachnospiraceae bacterium]|nr:RtcB family protein [Lachnospiraceae bacterium]